MNRWGVQLGVVILLLFAVIAFSCGGGGGSSQRLGGPSDVVPLPEDQYPTTGHIKLRGQLLKTPQGVPSGVRVTWERVTAASAVGYYLYRDDESIPDGDPEGYESLRVNGGDMIDQPGSGASVSFDDVFDPDLDSEWYYRLTVVNDTDDESDFSNQLSVTIVDFDFTGFDPTSGTVGDTVTLSGTNFGEDEPTEDVVYFTGASDWVEATITDWTQTDVDVTVPVGAMTGPIRMEIGGLYQNSGGDYTVLAPVADSIDPAEDYAEHNDITITGSRFEAAQGTSIVTFNGVEVDTYVSWSDTEVVVKVPDNATTGDVKVKVGANESNGVSFTVLPHIDSLDPDGGVVGDSFDVIGTGFGTTQGASTVTLSGDTCSVSNWGNLSITVTVPETESGNVVVTAGGNASNGVFFDVSPQVSGFSPTRSWVGQEVTISGTGFGPSQGSNKVYFYDGVEVTTYVTWGSNEIVVEIPAGAGTGTITVEVDGDDSVSDDPILIVLAPPNLDDVEQF
jgi:hypothetical protein